MSAPGAFALSHGGTSRLRAPCPFQVPHRADPTEYRTEHVGKGASLVPGCYAMLWAGDSPALRTATSKKRPEPASVYGDQQEPTTPDRGAEP